MHDDTDAETPDAENADAPLVPDEGGQASDAIQPPEGGDDADKLAKDLPETIELKHGFFTAIEKPYFRTLEDTGKPVMIMTLEEQGEVSLPLDGIRRELKLAADDPDAEMLAIIKRGLQYVQELRIGDPVPSELTTGQASWKITAEHRSIAHNRITMQLVSWMSGEETLITDPSELAQVADDPKTKEKINDAFSEAAKALGLPADERDKVVSLIANLAEELAYIEALRDKFHEILLTHKKIVELEQKYKSVQSVRDDILSIRRLFKIAIDGFVDTFDQLDAQTGEILAALVNIARVTKFIRENRDDLHRRLWAWDPVLHRWSDIPAQRSTKAEKALGDLYHFLAKRFLPRNEWELYSHAMDKTKKRSTEVVW